MMTEALAQQSIFSIVINLVFLLITWWALQTFRFDLFVKKPNSPQAKVLMILLTLSIGSLASNFFLDYYNWSIRLQYFF
ncbi:DUF1146 family protein [Guptibacillus hwajinpoensis]|uniref:Integral membrane protein (TIGR02327 family) n=1 Tax=Guptibacillus hwajinpoensis TaxID=208199 RepID=A0ABU0JZ71_9BACL|nr:putative integral membrane protein (TIGR02327 family) [Alkalihalobacillus hemicentroti]